MLLRHGESSWNRENKFTGWVDVPLSEKGEQEAQAAGRCVVLCNFSLLTDVLNNIHEHEHNTLDP